MKIGQESTQEYFQKPEDKESLDEFVKNLDYNYATNFNPVGYGVD